MIKSIFIYIFLAMLIVGIILYKKSKKLLKVGSEEQLGKKGEIYL